MSYLNFRNSCLQPGPQVVQGLFDTFHQRRVQWPTLLYVRSCKWNAKIIFLLKIQNFSRRNPDGGEFLWFFNQRNKSWISILRHRPRANHKMHAAHHHSTSLLFLVYFRTIWRDMALSLSTASWPICAQYVCGKRSLTMCIVKSRSETHERKFPKMIAIMAQKQLVSFDISFSVVMLTK